MKNTRSRLRFLGIYSWKRTPGKIFGIWATVVMTFALLSGTFLISDSMAETVRIRREESFGAWEIMLREAHPLLADRAADNALLAEAGRITIWQEGTFLPENADKEAIAAGKGKHYTVGTFDDTALAMSRLNLTLGRMPEKSGEAAVLNSCLLNLGLPDETGQTIICLIPDEDGIYQPAALTVVGVVKDYLANWSVAKNTDLPQVLVTEEDGQNMGLPSVDLLMRTGDAYDARTVMEDMKPAMDDEAARLTEALREEDPEQPEVKASLVHNKDAYPEKKEDEVDQLLGRIRLLVCMLGIAILFVTFRSEVDDKHDTWLYLNHLGAEHKDFVSIVFWEGIAYCFLAVPAALLLALGCTRGLCGLLSDALESPILWRVSLSHLGEAMGIGIVVAFLGFATGGLKILRIIRLAPDQKPVRITRAVRRTGKKRPMSLPLLSSCLHSLSSAPLRSLGLFLLTFVMASTLMLGTRLVYSEYSTLRHLRSRNSDFMVLYNGSGIGIKKADADTIAQFYGVRDVCTWISPSTRFYEPDEAPMDAEEGEESVITWKERGDGFSADLSLYRGEEYYEICRDVLSAWGPPESLEDFSITLAATDRQEELQRFIDHSECREGLSVEDLLAGDSVLIYVPPIVHLGDFTVMEDREEELAESDSEPIYEHSAKVGDLLTIRHSTGDGAVETGTVEVAGIMRTPYPGSEAPEFSFISPAIYLVSGTALFRAFPGYANGGDAIRQMDISLDGLSGYDLAADTTRAYLRKIAGLTSILGGFVLVITIVLYMQLIRSDMDRRRRAIRIYLQLGMKRTRLILQEMIPTAVLSILSVALTYVVMCVVYSYYRYQLDVEMGADFVMRWRVGFPIPGAAAILLLVFLFSVLAALLPTIRKTKDNVVGS